MTIRELFERKKRRIMSLALVGMAVAFVGTILAQSNVLNVEPPQAALPGISVFVIAICYANFFAYSCPRCQRNCALLASHGAFFKLDQNVRYCPYCGSDIDAELSCNET